MKEVVRNFSKISLNVFKINAGFQKSSFLPRIMLKSQGFEKTFQQTFKPSVFTKFGQNGYSCDLRDMLLSHVNKNCCHQTWQQDV